MSFGKNVSRSEAERMVGIALDYGVTRFDTSNNYSSGESERMLGSILRGRSGDVKISTKVGSPVGQDDPDVRGLSARAISKALDESLTRLGVDRIDTYFLHRPDNAVPISETLGALATAHQSGKVAHLGQSNFAAWQITEMVMLAESHGCPRPTVSQQMYSLVGRRIEAEYVSCAQHLQLATIAYNPLAGGLLTGRYSDEGDEPTEGRFANPQYRERYWKPELLFAVKQLTDVARSIDMSLISLAFRWLLANPSVDSVLVGASTAKQLEQNLASLSDEPLAEATLQACDEIWGRLAGAAPAYNR